MNHLQSQIAFNINPNVFVKDPLSSDLGHRIIRAGVDLIAEIGFDAFTFKKLASEIQSTEASIYRYFESKHNFLAYLTMWYWGWMSYQLVLCTMNIEDANVRLINCVKTLTSRVSEDMIFSQVNETKLQHIVFTESSKVYLNKNVDKDNQDGFFKSYKALVQFVADIVLEVRSEYKYPRMLITTIVESSHHQRFFADHLPLLTDVVDDEDAVTSCYVELVQKTLACV